MSNLSEDIIRTTLLGVANTLGVRIDISDETIAELAATLQAEIDRIEAVETESFEFLNELALAFRRGEKNARPQHTPILEGVRAVLAHLRSTGRILADNEMRLTAEQAEDVRTMLWSPGATALDAFRRLRALFPATEPAEHVHEQGAHYTKGHTKAGAWTVSTCRTCGAVIERATEDGPWIDRADPPAPAEPAEEETKAEAESDLDMHPDAVYGREYVEQAKVRRIARAVKECDTPSSSPVVPAPTETGPWQTWQEVPDGVKYYGINTWGPTYYVNRGGVRHRVFDDTPSKTADYIVQGSAPFVAAEEES